MRWWTFGSCGTDLCMYMCACVCMCVYICMHVCMCMYVSMYVYLCVCLCMYVCVRFYVRMSVCVYVCRIYRVVQSQDILKVKWYIFACKVYLQVQTCEVIKCKIVRYKHSSAFLFQVGPNFCTTTYKLWFRFHQGFWSRGVCKLSYMFHITQSSRSTILCMSTFVSSSNMLVQKRYRSVKLLTRNSEHVRWNLNRSAIYVCVLCCVLAFTYTSVFLRGDRCITVCRVGGADTVKVL
jgi:hypothetical protein